MRRLAAMLVVVAVLLVAAAVGDSVARHRAERELAQRIRTSQHLVTSPDVTIEGTPFLTQAIAGRYQGARVVISDLVSAGLPVQRLDVRLRGIRVPLGDLLRQQVRDVPVDRVAGTAHVTFAALTGRVNTAGIPGLRLSDDGGRLRIATSVAVPRLGTIPIQVSARIGVQAGEPTLSDAKVLDAPVPVPAEVMRPLLAAIAGPLRLRLPYGLRLTGVRVSATGVDVSAAATGVVLSGTASAVGRSGNPRP
jgi:hypothetical protein